MNEQVHSIIRERNIELWDPKPQVVSENGKTLAIY